VYAPAGATATVVRPRAPSGDTASTFILVAFILQCIASAVVFLIVIGLPYLAAVPSPAGAAVSIAALAIFLTIGAVAALMLYFAYEYSYRRARDGNYEGARTPTLVLGIVGIFFGAIITGILYLVAYAKLGDAIRELRGPIFYAAPVYASAVPYGAPMGGPVPAGAPPGLTPAPTAALPAAPPPPAPFAAVCPRCGQPATWIPQYGRYYCYRDAAYL
jgi:hypothetical protein